MQIQILALLVDQHVFDPVKKGFPRTFYTSWDKIFFMENSKDMYYGFERDSREQENDI